MAGLKSSFEQENLAHDGNSDRHSVPPPAYTSLPEAVRANMNALAIGDPAETISVPMILSTEQKRKRDMFFPGGKQGKVTQSVFIRKMTRDHYLKHYAKDAEGNYVGTEKAAPDAGLVFVPGKGSSEELLEQVRKVAFGRQHAQEDFPSGWVTTQAGGGAF